ncbi:PspC domain-containing protein [Mobilicoccus pelagius]|uniref:Phage shock protein PspC N-terminal domain-containing protein n=1 Tax=Mobilicoccus pelagius NBRC 104925 TaxID=1089455 RepID=H5UPC4_9MICO|nr:PspC domain-containing protein [Mobilicoccus pelagius]GAB47582.1 hypothetical protein MOPEL_021_00180 [Mobilicoccus pelagius NBRC 104925]
MNTGLVRTDRTDKVIGGVCGGIAHRFGWNPTIVRAATVASLMLPGPQLVAYLALWVLVPSERRV